MHPSPEFTREEMEFLRRFFRTDQPVYTPATRFARKHKKLLAPMAIALVLGFAGLQQKASIHGWWDAQIDVWHGHYELLAVGLPADWAPEYVRLLHERYGIEERAVAGCEVSQALGDYVSSYNRAIMRAANRRFGHDVFQESVAVASSAWQSQHPRPEVGF